MSATRQARAGRHEPTVLDTGETSRSATFARLLEEARGLSGHHRPDRRLERARVTDRYKK